MTQGALMDTVKSGFIGMATIIYQIYSGIPG